MPARIAPAEFPSPPHLSRSQGRVAALGILLSLAAALAYCGTFAVPLLFDDVSSIASNTSIRHLATAFFPPSDATVSGRPILNLSLALNYSVSGTAVWGYHALNLAIHILAGLTLFGIVRRTCVLLKERRATEIGFAVALLWMLHPLVTEAVTYVIQRAESLMGLFYLLTLYCFIRGVNPAATRATPWLTCAVAACFLGMGTKEVMVSAPLIVLLYDRTFVAGSFNAALRRRGWVYAALASTWLFLLYLVLAVGGRSGSAGFGVGVPWWSYALTQLPALVRYLWLSVWAYPLVFDYGSAVAHPLSLVAPCAVLVGVLLGATLWALVKRPALGFLGACFFAILAPSSSIVPVATEAMAEHRMYLPLIPVVAVVVAGAYRWLGQAARFLLALAAPALFLGTLQRNHDYRSELAIWSDTVAKRPQNERAQDNLGFALSKIPGREDEAIGYYEEALRLKPDFIEAHENLAYALLSKPGRLNDVISHYETAVRLDPDLVDVQFNLARALEGIPGRADEAIAHYEEAVRRRPDFAEAHYNLGLLLQSRPGRMGEAVVHLEDSVRLRPLNPGAQFVLGCALQDVPGRGEEAVAHYKEAVRLKPDYVAARCNLGNALNSMGRTEEAIGQYAEAARLAPGDPMIHLNFAIILLEVPGRAGEASVHLRDAVRLQPGNEKARQLLDQLGDASR